MPQKRMTRADIVVFVAITAVLVLLLLRAFVWDDLGSSFTVTTPDGAESYSLSADAVIDVESNGVHLTVEVKNGAVSVVSADCPDHTCKNSGTISSSGEAIVCVPARVVIEITKGGDAHDEDFIIG